MSGPTFTFGGIGSGMDVNSLISGLVGVARQPISRLQSRAAAARSAVTSMSEIGTLLSSLKNAAAELDSAQKVGSFKASSNNEKAVAISANGNAQPGSYQVEVVQLAKSARQYSNGVSNATAALGLNGSLTLQIGTGDLQEPGGTLLVGAATATFNLTADDSLDSIIQKINESDLRVKASAFFDGNEYRIQVRGLDAGSDNGLTITQNGFDLGFNEPENIKQVAQNAQVKIDDFLVESPTNQVSQAIQGVTIALKEETTEPFEITIESDPDALGKKLQGFVDAYNKVVDKLHTTAGFGDKKATNPMLSGDSTLRGVGSRLSQTLGTTFGTGLRNSLASVGVQLNTNGTLKLDAAKLAKAQDEDPKALENILAGDGSTQGVMDLVRDLALSLTDPTSGSVNIRKDGLDARAKGFSDQIAREEERLVSMEARLRKTFSHMDTYVSGQNAQSSFLLSNFR